MTATDTRAATAAELRAVLERGDPLAYIGACLGRRVISVEFRQPDPRRPLRGQAVITLPVMTVRGRESKRPDKLKFPLRTIFGRSNSSHATLWRRLVGRPYRVTPPLVDAAFGDYAEMLALVGAFKEAVIDAAFGRGGAEAA